MQAKPIITYLGVALLGTVACGTAADSASPRFTEASRVAVVASFYPLAEAAIAIGGDRVEVINLTPPGSSPHSVELVGKVVEEIEKADVVVYLGGGFQPSIEKVVEGLPASTRAFDLLPRDLLAVDSPLAGVEGEVEGTVLEATVLEGTVVEGDLDPHVWLDPIRFRAMAQALAAALVDVDPEGKATYTSNAADYARQLDDLHRDMTAALADCDSRVVVTSHRAFGYLADRYDLVQLPIAGISPDEEPSPRSLRAVAEAARREGVRTVFFEELVPRKLADTVAREIGAESSALNPIEGVTTEEIGSGVSYSSIQRANLAALASGLGCRRG